MGEITAADRTSAWALADRLGMEDLKGPRNQEEIASHFARHHADNRRAVIRECAEAAGDYQDVDCNSSNYEDQIFWQGHCQGRDDSKTAILALIERDE